MWLITPKQHPHVAAVLRLPSKILFALICGLFLQQAQAEEHFLGQLHAHSPIELSNLLDRAEHWSENTPNYPENAITIVLHGPEAQVFVKGNYPMYRQLVDKAAKLDAFNVVDIKICETWMGMNQIKRSQLPAFVDTVPFGPAEEGRLIKAGYQKF